ncbi:MAG TPA: COX15/CtaA family protein [Pyrinomonadaceae bacterium]|jgi:heme A synthase|nr:COX15/CtaA family protein [Pyrinomonadaceae bacterium]
MSASENSTGERADKERSRRLALYAGFTTAFNLLVIVWGAYVRASYSGDGCGSHWPLCNGEVVPAVGVVKTLVEFSHRLSSGAALLLVVGLVFASRRVRARGDRVRRAAAAALVFILFEALIGAALVKFRLVVRDDSAARALVMSLHLANTFLLLASLALAAWWATAGGTRVRLRGQGKVGWLFGVALLGALCVAVSGAVTALGDTLFPARTLAEGFRQDLASSSHFLLRLRTLHPAIAIIVGCYAVMSASYVGNFVRSDARLKRLTSVLTSVFVAQVCIGILNITLLAPVWLQLTHLLVADLFWIALVLTAAAALSDAPQEHEAANGRSALRAVAGHV